MTQDSILDSKENDDNRFTLFVEVINTFTQDSILDSKENYDNRFTLFHTSYLSFLLHRQDF